MPALMFTLLPIVAVILGAAVASWRRPGPAISSAVQHLAAGVVFAAAATEILPQVMHQASPVATIAGGLAGVVTMLSLKSLEARIGGALGLLSAVGLDIFIDGLVLGLAFIAGGTAGLLLTVALTLEVLFIGLSVTTELLELGRTRRRVIAIVAGLALLLPLGTLVATPVALLSPNMIAAFLTFGLISLLYLVTEELLVEAHEKPDTPLISAMFFVGFLALLVLEEMIG